MPLTERQAFKAVFLAECADRGLSMAQAADLVKQAEEKAALLGGLPGKAWSTYTDLLSSLYKNLGTYAVPAVAVGPLAVGTMGGYMAGRYASDPDEADTDEIKQQDELQAYRQQSEQMKLQNSLAKRRQISAKPRGPGLLY